MPPCYNFQRLIKLLHAKAFLTRSPLISTDVLVFVLNLPVAGRFAFLTRISIIYVFEILLFFCFIESIPVLPKYQHVCSWFQSNLCKEHVTVGSINFLSHSIEPHVQSYFLNISKLYPFSNLTEAAQILNFFQASVPILYPLKHQLIFGVLVFSGAIE